MSDRASQPVQAPVNDDFPTNARSIIRKLVLLFVIVVVSMVVSALFTGERGDKIEEAEKAPALSPLESMKQSDAQLPAGFGE